MPISHDERIKLANRLMREHIDPATRPIGEAAVLIVLETGNPKGGLMTYIANCERASVRSVLRELLAKWDREAAERGER